MLLNFRKKRVLPQCDFVRPYGANVSKRKINLTPGIPIWDGLGESLFWILLLIISGLPQLTDDHFSLLICFPKLLGKLT